MKKLFALLLAAVLLLSLCACGTAAEPAAQEEPEAAEETETPAEEPEAAEPEEQEEPAESEETPEETPVEEDDGLWYDSYGEKGTYTDELGTIHSYNYVLPAVRAEGTEAEALNAQILEDFEEAVRDLHSAIEESREPMYSTISYNGFRSGDIVSFLLTLDTGVNDVVEYRTYSFNTETGTVLTGEDLLAMNGYTEEQFCTAAAQCVSDYFEEVWSAFAEDEFYTVQYRKTVSADAFGSFLPLFLNDEGELCFVATVYALAGADSYEIIFRLFG